MSTWISCLFVLELGLSSSDSGGGNVVVFQAAPLPIIFMVVDSMVPQILVADMIRLVSETVVNIV